MSEASERFNRRKTKYTEAFAEAVQKMPRRQNLGLSTFLIIALVGTMAPLISANIFFSIASIVSISIIWLLRERICLPRFARMGAAMLALVSIATGCSPTWTKIDADALDACLQLKGNTCRFGTAIGYSICGITVREATIDQARQQGGIDKVFGIETVKGYGLVSVTRLTVIGG